MAIALSLDHASSMGGVILQCWTLTGDGSGATIATGLARPIAAWAQNEDDATKTGTSLSISGGTVTLAGAKITSTKKWKLFVIGE